MRRNKWLAAAGILLISQSASASYHDGAWGLFILFALLLPAAIVFIVSLVLAAAGLYKQQSIVRIHAILCGIVIIGAVVVSLSASDLASTLIVLLGAGFLFVIASTPALIEYSRARSTGTLLP